MSESTSPVRERASRRRAVVLVSGGLDSATCLAIAKAEGYACHALSFAYGQRHEAELVAAARVAGTLGAIEHRVMSIDLGVFGGSAGAAPEQPAGWNAGGSVSPPGWAPPAAP